VPCDNSLPSAVLFDMDGTLTDSEKWWYAAERDILGALGVTWTEERAHTTIGAPLEWVCAKVIREDGLEVSAQELAADMSRRVCEVARTSGVIWRPGAYELLELCVRLGIPTALVTSSFQELADVIRESAPHGSLTVSVASDSEVAGKPSAQPYLLAAQRLDVAAGDCVIFEDSVFGVRSAMAARSHAVAVPFLVEIPSWPLLLRVNSLEEVGEAELRGFMSAPRPAGDPLLSPRGSD